MLTNQTPAPTRRRSTGGLTGYLRKAAVLYQQADDRYGHGTALNNLGSTLREARRFDEAITVLQKAAAIFRGDQYRERMVLLNLERTYIAQKA